MAAPAALLLFFYSLIAAFLGVLAALAENIGIFAFVGLILLILIAPIVVWLLFLLGSIGIFKRGKESVDAETYREKLPGTVIFISFLGIAVFSSLSFLFLGLIGTIIVSGQESLAGLNAVSYFILYGISEAVLAIPLILSAIGVVLVILDIVKNGKDLAKIK
jgi:hypothetical protein